MLMILLFTTGLFAGAVDAIAGGGGLITLPIILSTGMPPHIAFGTSKLQSIVGTFTAVKHYYQQGLISFKKITMGLVFGLIGSMTGAITAQIISSQILHTIVPILLTCVLIHTLVSPKLGMEDRAARLDNNRFYSLFGLLLGFYDGFFGPGVGALWVFALTFFMGYNLIKATAHTKALNLNSSTIATICFVVGGNVDYRIAACMAAGQFIGGRLGAKLAIKNGAQLIRPIFLSVVTSTIAVLIYRSYATEAVFTPQIMVAVTITATGILIYRRRRSQTS